MIYWEIGWDQAREKVYSVVSSIKKEPAATDVETEGAASYIAATLS